MRPAARALALILALAASSPAQVLAPPAPWPPLSPLLRPASAPPPAPRERLRDALALLRTSPTGRALVDAATRSKVDILIVPGEHVMLYRDGANQVQVGRAYLELPAWQCAVFLAHELEHARQRSLGLTGERARAHREAAAFRVQSRAWVELGGRVLEEDWRGNTRNSRDMWAWLEHPSAVDAALALRGGHAWERGWPELAAYWEDVLASEGRWRGGRRLPAGRDGRRAALFVLRQASQVSPGAPPGGVSEALPAWLEAAAALAPGAGFDLPGEPTARDRRALGSLPAPVELVSGPRGWRVESRR